MFTKTLEISERAPTKYPKSVGFIISNEFCERFNYYGMRTILVLYLTDKLGYQPDTATVLFHEFTMLVYLCPLIGAIVADSWLGKFKTILYLSVVYAVGTIVIALGAVPTLPLPTKEATIAGLVLIAFGTGGIKPCVSAFGGDQFRLPEQAKQLATFFSLFYFAINAGSMISTSLTPILRADVHCFGDKDCYSLAFGLPAVLMLLSVLIFIAGKRLYIMKPAEGNMIVGVTKCVTDAISGWRRERKTNPRKHFLDYAEPCSGQKLVSDTKLLMRILVLYLPFPVFWALFDQQGSRWTFQAKRMDGETFGYNIKPDQMQVVNPLLILGFIPLFDYVIYPLLAKIGIKRALQKLVMGGMLAALAFLLSAWVELKLENEGPHLPHFDTSHVRLYNGMPCKYDLWTNLPVEENYQKFIEPLGMWELKNVPAADKAVYSFNVTTYSKLCPNVAGLILLMPGKEVSYFIANDRVHEFEDSSDKPLVGNPVVRFLLNTPDVMGGVMTVTDPADLSTMLVPYLPNQAPTLLEGESDFTVNGKSIAKIETKAGGVYALVANGYDIKGYSTQLHTLTNPNTVHMMWQLPQIVAITAAEIMFSVTGLEFSYSQAPQSMKSVLQACWLLSVAIGNMMVVVIAEMKFFKSQAAEFALFAALMIVDMIIFMLLTLRYKYVEHPDDPDAVESANCQQKEKSAKSATSSDGHSNAAYDDYEH